MDETTESTRTTEMAFVAMEDGKQVMYRRAESGYCTRGGRRIPADQFEAAAKAQMEREERRSRRGGPRTPKDVALQVGDKTLTAKQADFLRELDAAGEAALGSPDGGWWCDCICDAIGGQFAGRPMAVGAMISTLCEKGLGTRSKEQRETGGGRTRRATSFTLTASGREMWRAMGLR